MIFHAEQIIDLTAHNSFEFRMVESHPKYNYVLQENDPPPWLHRMRELGYPPGYLGKPNFSTHFNICEVCKLLFLMFIVLTTLVKKRKSQRCVGLVL